MIIEECGKLAVRDRREVEGSDVRGSTGERPDGLSARRELHAAVGHLLEVGTVDSQQPQNTAWKGEWGRRGGGGGRGEERWSRGSGGGEVEEEEEGRRGGGEGEDEEKGQIRRRGGGWRGGWWRGVEDGGEESGRKGRRGGVGSKGVADKRLGHNTRTHACTCAHTHTHTHTHTPLSNHDMALCNVDLPQAVTTCLTEQS